MLRTHDLLARLTLALAAVAAPLIACGGETADGGTGQNGTSGTGGVGGGGSGGSGGSLSSAGAAGDSGAAGTLGIDCQRPLPEKGPAGFGEGCRAASDCPSNTETCVLPGESLCSFGGGPSPPTCTTDAACDQGTNAFWVCQEDDAGGSFCAQACTNDSACTPGRRCDQDGHCVPRSCLGDSPPCPESTFCSSEGTCRKKQCDAARPCGIGLSCSTGDFTCQPRACQPAGPGNGGCPDTFTCTLNSGGASCLRTTCTCDGQCGASGFCLAGTCQETAGTCSGNVACGRPILVAGAPRLAPLATLAWG